MSAELPSISPVYVSEIAVAAGLSEKTVRQRMHIWEADPCDPLGIPFRPDLGKPLRMTRQQAVAFLTREKSGRMAANAATA